jgi:ribosomal protein S18 acetylase RimI-like enzyme
MYEVRRARLDEVNSIVSLWNGLMRDQNHFTVPDGSEKVNPDLRADCEEVFKSFARRTIHSKNGIVLLSLLGDEPVGYLIGYIQDFIPVYEMKKIAYLSDLYVSDNHRGNGLATRMSRDFETWALGKGVDHSTLQVIHNNDRARKLYSRLGYKETLISMRKSLDP